MLVGRVQRLLFDLDKLRRMESLVVAVAKRMGTGAGRNGLRILVPF